MEKTWRSSDEMPEGPVEPTVLTRGVGASMLWLLSTHVWFHKGSQVKFSTPVEPTGVGARCRCNEVSRRRMLEFNG
jgi:hypothetical protein